MLTREEQHIMDMIKKIMSSPLDEYTKFAKIQHLFKSLESFQRSQNNFWRKVNEFNIMGH